jgi:hypothetical protein
MAQRADTLNALLLLGVHDFAIRIDNADPGVRVTIDCWSRTLA